MAPKKKGGKRQEEDWEAELGESAPGADGAPTPTDEPAQDGDGAGGDEDNEMGGGGLLAALRKNKNKKAKKGKPVNDFVEGEDPSQDTGDQDFTSKAPEEGTFDEDDVFAGKKPAKGGKAKQAVAAKKDEEDGDVRVKSKKEKEKEKKEREKQRKKEQVCLGSFFIFL